jgi:isopentenyl-diphosphate delta-isomerase type 1
MERKYVILVNEQDQEKGKAEKLAAHQQALLHRAFSVFIFRTHADQVELLMQQRHPDKYHCGGLWTNTCCSHQQPGEQTIAAGKARLQEEMGFSVDLTHAGHFIYKAAFENGLTEYEYDHVLIGCYNGDINRYNRDEIAQVRWVPLQELNMWCREQPHILTPWFLPALLIAKQELDRTM